MKMSKNGLDLLKEWEGCVLHVYRDAAGLPTIGVGHLLTPRERSTGAIMINGISVVYGSGITEKQALDLLAQDVVPAEHAVSCLVTVSLTQCQFDALTSFVFNCGDGAFASSTLLKEINAGDLDQVPAQFSRWNKAGGKVCDGLVARRNNEIRLWRGEI